MVQAANDQGDHLEAREVRQSWTICLSDIHLGTKGCRAEYLLDFLKHSECERLYLVGDIVDG